LNPFPEVSEFAVIAKPLVVVVVPVEVTSPALPTRKRDVPPYDSLNKFVVNPVVPVFVVSRSNILNVVFVFDEPLLQVG
jgi:hypothetical protein